MLKILKNLKQSWISVLVIVSLLCLQAAVDLELPNYTSKIVNEGIQSGGIENVAPNVINKEDMETILMFTENDDVILESYSIASSTDLEKNQKRFIKNYIEDSYDKDNIYIIKDLDEQQTEELSKLMTEPIIISQTLKQEEISNQIKQQIFANMPADQVSAMENMSLIEIIKTMPQEQTNQILQQATEQINNMQESIKEQAATANVKSIYANAGINTDRVQMNYILIAGLKMLALAAISMASGITIMMLSSRVGARMSRTLRDKVFSKVLKFSQKELREFSTASLITRSTNDIQQIQQLLAMLFRTVVYAPIIGIGGVIKVVHQSNSSMAWIIGLVVIAVLIVVAVLFAIAMPKFKKLQGLIDKLNGVAREILTGKSVIRAFNTEEREENRFDEANKDLTKVNIFVNRTMSVMMPMLMLIMNSMSILIIWVGGHNIDQGVMQVGDMLAFIQYSMQIIMSFLMISMISIMLPRASVSANRIMEVIETEPSIKDKEETKKLNPDKKGLVEFKNVSFRYPDADTEILEDINFTAEAGKTTAIIGSTGSGKSTVVNLIPRFYDVTGGELLVDGVNVKDLSQKELRDIIGFVPQKGILFSGTIESNIKYASQNISDEQMRKAAEIAQATDFIEEKDNKYSSEIAQGGNNVSGGQKQRLSIARAIAKEPEIFVFDDSFSALDFKTDSALREALAKQTKNKTNIIVAQRISTILNADKIIVLDDGKIVGQGTHEELMKNNETYREIALSQLSENELNQKEGGE
ncbi:MAG: ABC transporter ATP-binding protein [Clostridia bacterium]|nr:ABC transporter ATP-binding protein [Clostridia bacterium]